MVELVKNQSYIDLVLTKVGSCVLRSGLKLHMLSDLCSHHRACDFVITIASFFGYELCQTYTDNYS